MKTIEKEFYGKKIAEYYDDDYTTFLFSIRAESKKELKILWYCKNCGNVIFFKYHDFNHIKYWTNCDNKLCNPAEYRQDICNHCNFLEKKKYLSKKYDQLTEEERFLNRLNLNSEEKIVNGEKVLLYLSDKVIEAECKDEIIYIEYPKYEFKMKNGDD